MILAQPALIVIIAFASLAWAESVNLIELSEADEARLERLTPVKAFAYLSGASHHRNGMPNHHNHPAMYCGSVNREHFVYVVGNGCYEEFPISQLDKAFARYTKLLEDRKYLPAPQ